MSAAETTERPVRRVHWLELVFDLVMVAYVGQVAHRLHGDPGWLDALAFFALLASAWWVWVNTTLTMNLFGARVTPLIWSALTVIMIAIGVMAAAVPEALAARAAAFAVANAVVRLVWSVPWFANRRSIGLPWWRPVAYCVVPAAIWLVSALAPPPADYLLWAAAIAVEVGLLAALGGQREWLRRALDVDHLAERVGLFVVIVFGESILSIIGDLDAHWGLLPGIAAGLAFLAVSLLAWQFFGYATPSVEAGWHLLQRRGRIGALRDTVMYLPFVLVAGVVLFAAALGTAVADAEHVLPIGAAVSLSAGISLFFVASCAEALIYGLPWRDVAAWAPAGIVLPWLLLPLAGVTDAVLVVAATAVLIAVLVGVNAASVRRVRARAGDASAAQRP